jgi:hypothetical protein
MGKKTNGNGNGNGQSKRYSEILVQIGQCLDQNVDENREDVFEQLKTIIQTLSDEHINVDEMCRSTGIHSYNQSKYLMGYFYLTLGECYDFAFDPESANYELAKKYYALSDQPPAKWRLAKLYLDHHIRYDGNVEVIAGRLITEAIHSLLTEMKNQRYFFKRLEYVESMYRDLQEMDTHDDYHEIFYEILEWVISNHDNVRPEHHDMIELLLGSDMTHGTPREKQLYEKVERMIR